MISTLLNNDSDIGVEPAKLALAIFNSLSRTMTDPQLQSVLEQASRQHVASRRNSEMSETNHEGVSSETECDIEDSSSYATAEDHSNPSRIDSEISDDTMKTSLEEVEATYPDCSSDACQSSGSLYGNGDVFYKNIPETYHIQIHQSNRKSKQSPAVLRVLADFQSLNTVTASSLNRIFDCFKGDSISDMDCDDLAGILKTFQVREDFQWSLHQLGGFDAALFLYARVVEICNNDVLQSKYLTIVLNQMKCSRKCADYPDSERKELIRYLLNATKSTFGLQTFMTLVRSCLNPKGNRIEDFELLHSCLLSSWRRLLRNRTSELDTPHGSSSLFECFLRIVLELCVENGPHRDYNLGLLKLHRFHEILLCICTSMTQETVPETLTTTDASRIAKCVKAIFNEMMAPPDGAVAVAFIRYGLLPILPRELPPLPRRSDAFFLYHGGERSSIANLYNVVEGEEVVELEQGRRTSVSSSDNDDRRVPDVPEILGVCHRPLTTVTKLTHNGHREDFVSIFQSAILEAIMSTLLGSFAILPDDAFRKLLEPSTVAHIFMAYCSHPESELKALAIQLLAAYLTRVKNPITTEFIKNGGFFLATLYTQGNPELVPRIQQICTVFGPLSYALVNGLIYSNDMLNTVLQWMQHDENVVVSSLLSMGFLPSVVNYYNNSQDLPRPLVTLLNEITKSLVLNPKDDPWKILFCQGIESVPSSNYIVSRILQDATEILRRYNGKELKKGDITTRLLWLLERSSCTRIGHQFDKWLLKVYVVNVMEIDESEESEGWRQFVKKYKRRLNYLMGLFLCRILAPNQGNLDFKQYAIRCLILSCTKISEWLPKVVRCDDQIERCFTAFTKVFVSESETRHDRLSGDRSRRASFHSLIASHGNLVLSLRTAAAVGLPNDLNEDALTSQNQRGSQSIAEMDVHLTDRAVRSRFEGVLIDAGILSQSSTTNSPSLFSSSSDFKTFKILLEATPISGVSHSELRQCLTTLDKLKASTLAKSSMRRSSSSGSIKINNNPSSLPQLTISNSATYFESIFESVHTFSMEVLDVVTRARTKQDIEVARRISLRDADIMAKESWWRIRQSLGHPKAPWHFPGSYPTFWSLDQSEGPSRVRTRLRKEPLRIPRSFLKPDYQTDVPADPLPLNYLFESDQSECLNYPVLISEVEFIRFCVRIVPGEEYPGEVILSGDSLYFFCETCHTVLNHCEKVKVPRSSIYQILRRRYTLENRAAEIFVNNQSYFFVFRTQRDREDFVQVFSTKLTTLQTPSWLAAKSLLLNSSLSTVTAQWVKGSLSNFNYLMYLNTAAGRTYCDLMQYPVFPFVLSKYATDKLDLTVSESYRDLRKPMAIQDPMKEQHYVSTYNYLKKECGSTPFHYGSHYSNSGIVLHFLVRLPPYTQHFLKYQDGSFDIPDRSFHSVETTWKLASRDSNTDFKEAIPEFFYLPEFLQNLQNFDLGLRQNESRVDDVVLPPWAKNSPRIFTLVNRQALESEEVRKNLGDWFDLIFGFKQTGKPAVQALNVFHPSTYEGFEVDADGADDVIQRARRAMVSTYGQTPKQLFPFPHPKPQIYRDEDCDLEVIDTVYGIQWGQFLGSPASPKIEIISTRDYKNPVELFESATRVVFWPERTLILGDTVVGSWDSSGVRIKSNIIYLCVADEITTCTGIDTDLWVGHQSGRITVLKLSVSLESVLEKVELVGHHQAIRNIDLNQEFSVALSCSGESYVIAWDMNRIAFTNVIEEDAPIDFAYSSRSTGDIVLMKTDQNVVSFKTINGFRIGEIRPEESIESVCISSLDPGKNVNLIVVGFENGVIRFYSTWDLRPVNEFKVAPIWTLPVQRIRYSRDGRRMYCMSESESKHIVVALQLSTAQK